MFCAFLARWSYSICGTSSSRAGQHDAPTFSPVRIPLTFDPERSRIFFQLRFSGLLLSMAIFICFAKHSWSMALRWQRVLMTGNGTTRENSGEAPFLNGDGVIWVSRRKPHHHQRWVRKSATFRMTEPLRLLNARAVIFNLLCLFLNFVLLFKSLE